MPPDEKNTVDQASERTEPVTDEDGPVTRQDVQAVVNDPGYSANERKGWLKELLTALTRRGANARRKESGD